MYGYHVGEHTPHSYQANPLGWLFLVRPTSMYWHANGNNAETILDVANPLIWWAGTAAILFLVVRMVRGLVLRHSVSREAFILTGIAAGFLPWLLYLERTVFQFYTIAFEPFLVLALTAAIALLLGESAGSGAAAGRRVAGGRHVPGAVRGAQRVLPARVDRARDPAVVHDHALLVPELDLTHPVG